jgi:hypothetical protein
VAAGVVAGAAGVAADVPGDADDDAPEVRCFLLFLGALASIVQSGVRACAEASVFHSRPRRSSLCAAVWGRRRATAAERRQTAAKPPRPTVSVLAAS